jgi:hypothetical protein
MAWDEHARHGEAVEYGASNPHPLFGKDPNILNEMGHTKYPMHINHPTEKDASGKWPKRVVVQDEDEHEELVGAVRKSKAAADWTAGK